MAETNKPNQDRQKVQAAFANLHALLREELKDDKEGTKYSWYLNCCERYAIAASTYYTTAQRAKDSE